MGIQKKKDFLKLEDLKTSMALGHIRFLDYHEEYEELGRKSRFLRTPNWFHLIAIKRKESGPVPSGHLLKNQSHHMNLLPLTTRCLLPLARAKKRGQS